MRRRAVLAALLLAGSTLCASPAASAADAQAAGDWKQSRYDAAHTGFNPAETTIGVDNAAALTLRWRKALRGAGSPIVSHGNVYACGLPLCSSRLLDNGQQVWQSLPRGHAGGLATAEGRLFVNTRGNIAILDPASGAPLGGFSEQGFFYPPVVYHAGRIFTTNYGKVRAWDASATPPCCQENLIWESQKAFALGDAYLWSSPTVAYNRVYVTGCKLLIAYREDNGRYRWSAPLPGPAADDRCGGQPVAADHRIFVANTYVTAYDYLTGAVLWSVPGGGGRLVSQPAVANGLLYVVSRTGTLTAYHGADGSVAWSTPDVQAGAPTIANGLVYVPGPTGLDVIDAATGARVTTLPGSFSGEAAVSDGHVAVDCADATLGAGVCVFALPG